MVAPIILGALATWSVLQQPDVAVLKWATATCALLAGLFPAIFEALKLDAHLDEIVREAAAYKGLQDQFRLAWRVTALGGYEEFRTEFDALKEKLDAARATSITPPESCFKAAQAKIAAGDYDFNVDLTIDKKSDPPAR